LSLFLVHVSAPSAGLSRLTSHHLSPSHNRIAPSHHFPGVSSAQSHLRNTRHLPKAPAECVTCYPPAFCSQPRSRILVFLIDLCCRYMQEYQLPFSQFLRLFSFGKGIICRRCKKPVCDHEFEYFFGDVCISIKAFR
jgi:hypothetical protein